MTQQGDCSILLAKPILFIGSTCIFLTDTVPRSLSPRFVCGPPSSVELHVKSPKGSRAASCPTEGDKVRALFSGSCHLSPHKASGRWVLSSGHRRSVVLRRAAHLHRQRRPWSHCCYVVQKTVCRLRRVSFLCGSPVTLVGQKLS